LACIQSLVQPTKSLKLALSIFQRAWKPKPPLIVGRKSLQTHYFEPRTNLFLQSWYISTQQVPDLFVLAHQNDRPFSSLGSDELGSEPLLREPIHKPTNSQMDVDEFLLGDLHILVAIICDNRPQTLLRSLDIAQMPVTSGCLCLPGVRSATRGSLEVARTLWNPTTFRSLGPRVTRPVLRWYFTSLSLEPRSAELLLGVSLTTLGRRPRFRRPYCFWPSAESQAETSARLTYPAHLLAAPLRFLFLFQRSRVPRLSFNTSRFPELSLHWTSIPPI